MNWTTPLTRAGGLRASLGCNCGPCRLRRAPRAHRTIELRKPGRSRVDRWVRGADEPAWPGRITPALHEPLAFGVKNAARASLRRQERGPRIPPTSWARLGAHLRAEAGKRPLPPLSSTPLRVERQPELFQRRMGLSRHGHGFRHHPHSCHQTRCCRRCFGHFGPSHRPLALGAMLNVCKMNVGEQPSRGLAHRNGPPLPYPAALAGKRRSRSPASSLTLRKRAKDGPTPRSHSRPERRPRWHPDAPSSAPVPGAETPCASSSRASATPRRWHPRSLLRVGAAAP